MSIKSHKIKNTQSTEQLRAQAEQAQASLLEVARSHLGPRLGHERPRLLLRRELSASLGPPGAGRRCGDGRVTPRASIRL